MSLCAAPLAMLMGFVGTKGLRSQDDLQAILYVMGIVLSVGLACGIAALWGSRELGPERLRGKAIIGIALIIGFAGILAFFVGA